ncbi:MAG: glycosyltransferase [Anaeromyxobacteraceae bacterium]
MIRRLVWVVSPFAAVPPPVTTDRYAYVCSELARRGASVTQFVSRFDHHSKSVRAPTDPPWRCVRVYEPGYSSNLSYGRLASHAIFDSTLPIALAREAMLRGAPDAILLAVPHNGAAAAGVLFSRLVGALSIVDVHDTWPESLLGVRKVKGIQSAFFSAWKRIADFAYRRADLVFAESIRYADRANEVRIPAGLPPAVPILLGGDLAYYRGIAPAPCLPEPLRECPFVAAYVGTLGQNYDLDCVVEGFLEYSRENPGAGLMLLGAGEREQELRERLRSIPARSWVSGRIPHASLVAHLKNARVGLNAFRAGGNVAYSYKLNDYLLSGVPVVNSLDGESAEVIERAGLGYRYQAGDASSLASALRACEARWRSEPSWGERVLAFASRTLDRETIYRPMLGACLGSPPRS